MQNSDQLNTFEETNKIPSGLNVLTILTFIGCSIGVLMTIFAPMIYDFSLKMMDKASSSGQELSAKQVADMEKGRAAIEVAKQHMVPTMIIGIIGIILCFVGALWMRKFKKDGYWIYVAGELLPIVGILLITGFAQFTGIMSIVLGMGIPVLFVILYTMQRKYLTK
jgi:uncharacterized membrane protein YgdD (TMEM256/DUF423 family)